MYIVDDYGIPKIVLVEISGLNASLLFANNFKTLGPTETFDVSFAKRFTSNVPKADVTGSAIP